MIFKLDSEARQAKAELDRLIDKKARIELKEKRERRSIDQNALYWLWLTHISNSVGYTKEDLHLLYRAKFLQKDETYITSIIYAELWEKLKVRINRFQLFDGLDMVINIISYSTSKDLNTKEMTEYMENIRDHAAQTWGIVLLTLEEEGFWSFYNETY